LPYKGPVPLKLSKNFFEKKTSLMNHLKLISAVFIFSLFTITSCENSLAEDVSINDVAEVLSSSGEWQVTYFWDKDKEETHEFSGYTFQFKAGGVFEALKDDKLTSGSWSVNSSSQKLIINIGQVKPLEELTDDWIILEKSDQLIKLKDDNDEHVEEIHFRLL